MHNTGLHINATFPQSQNSEVMPNRLISEQSPYLLQHAHNPVNWYPWGDEAFERARAEHKPVIVSIGYSACHWCHVMEHESFENEEVAAYMNEHFICIKVDREEHPDVDHMYMDAVQAIGGSGGWPLNVFATADRAPFYGGTYYPPRPAYNRPSWMQLLHRMNGIWHEQHDEVKMQTGQMIRYLTQASQKTTGVDNGGVAAELNESLPGQIAASLLKQADAEKGGFGNAPKFPGTMAISFLLEHYHFTGQEPSLKHALRSLDAMIEGGIYDQLAGGFARYATDRNWLIPHFEKMLYDNALLIVSLCDAFSITKDRKYKAIIEETIAFAERELKDVSGGYYCALDADSEGEEGKFYTWSWEEWEEAARPFESTLDEAIAEAYFGVRKEGNWEATNILHIAERAADVAQRFDVQETYVTELVNRLKGSLMAARQHRVRPGTDDKCLLSWNALMNTALTSAGVALSEEKYLQQAAVHMQWMLGNYERDGQLLHTWKGGVARIPAKLDDYAYLIYALLKLGSANGDNNLLQKAGGYVTYVIENFSCENLLFYYTPAHQQDIPVRKVDTYDGATPSANAFMAYNLWVCGMCLSQSEWIERAGRMLAAMAGTVARYSYSFSFWAILIQRKIQGMRTIVCASPHAVDFRREMLENYLPQAYLVTSAKKISELPIVEKKYFDSGMSIFVCSEEACLSPVNTIKEALLLLSG